MMQAEAEKAGRVALSFGDPLTKEVNQKQLVDIRPKMQSLDERIADMDRMGVDVAGNIRIALPVLLLGRAGTRTPGGAGYQ